MIGEKAICEREGCGVEYVKKTHNQKYHEDACTKLATNANMKKKYHERKDQLSGKIRRCIRCEVTKLSRYNPGNTCSACQSIIQEQRNEEVISMFASVTLV